MRKCDEINDPTSTWNRTAADEPVFIVVGRDALGAVPIAAWIEAARATGVPAPKIQEAEALLEDFRWWESKKVPD